MKIEDFKVGKKFYYCRDILVCTDIGKHSVNAECLSGSFEVTYQVNSKKYSKSFEISEIDEHFRSILNLEVIIKEKDFEHCKTKHFEIYNQDIEVSYFMKKDVFCRIVHVPSGFIASRSSDSKFEAYKSALDELSKILDFHLGKEID